MDSELRVKILDLVHVRPRAVSEIADAIGKNWRTADRYIDQLAKEDMLKIHVFRKGGRGALKVVYWPTSINESPSSVKNFLLQKILNNSRKEDFSALDIIQNITEKRRKIRFMDTEIYDDKENLENFLSFLGKAENRLLFFSGNLSLMNISKGYKVILGLFDQKLSEGVNIFMLTRVDASNSFILRDLLNLNKKGNLGKVEIRYAYQPLRCTVVDQKEMRLKENFLGNSFDRDGKNNGTYLYVTDDVSWVDWMSDVFWHIWHGSISAEKRLEVLKTVV